MTAATGAGWLWRDLISGDMKLVLALALAIAVAVAGFLSAEAMSSASESSLTKSEQVVTVQRTIVRKVVTSARSRSPSARRAWSPRVAPSSYPGTARP